MAREMQAVTKMYDVLKWLLPQISKLPRSHKFTLGDRVTNLGLDVLMLLVEASYTRDKLELLRQANLKLDMPTRIKRLGTMYNFRSQIDPLRNELSGSGYALLDSESFRHYQQTDHCI